MKINNSNDARESLLDTIANLKSGKATNLEEVALEIKAFAVLNGLQDRHHEECRINGKTSAKQNSGWGKYAKQMSSVELEAKAQAKAEKVSAELAQSKRQAAYRKRKKSKIESPSVMKIAKRGPGRPKGSKSKARTLKKAA